jgi:hypothetical protein
LNEASPKEMQEENDERVAHDQITDGSTYECTGIFREAQSINKCFDGIVGSY